MNELPTSAMSPVQVKSLPAVAVSHQDKGQKSGNVLPQPAEAATSRPASSSDFEMVQAKVKAAVAQMNEYIQSTQRDLQFSLDPDSGETVVRVLDRKTQEVIRQIPDETFLKLAQSLERNEPVSLFSAQV